MSAPGPAGTPAAVGAGASAVAPAKGRAAVELELKLALPAAQAERLRRHPALRPISPHRAVVAELDAIYFDTPDLALQAQGIAVRLREAGGHWVQTVKGRGDASGALHRRLEWEMPSEGAGLDFSQIDDPALRRLLLAPDMATRLQPVFRTRFRRWARLLVLPDGTRVELALDQGHIEAGPHQAPICEVEFELKGGRAEALFELALALQPEVALTPEPRSKAERGYRLFSGGSDKPTRARPPALDPAQPATLAAAAFLGAGCEQLQRNLAGACVGQDPEFLHQARVALRRLRASLGLFRPLLPAPDAAHLGAELRWLMGETNDGRDWDVFCLDTLPQVCRSFPVHAGLAALGQAASQMRAQGQARAAAALSSSRSMRLQLELGRLAALLGAAPSQDAPPEAVVPVRPEAAAADRRKGGAKPATADQPAAGPSLKEFARRSLRRRRRRATLTREQLAALDVTHRHEWRIALKKLRYAGDYLAPVLGKPAPTKKWIAALATLQDILGALNDAATTERLLALLPATQASLGEAQALVRGWLAGACQVRLEHLEEARNGLERTPAPWKT